MFDLKHKFVILKSIFGSASKEYIGSQGLIGGGSFIRINELSNQSFHWLPIGFIGLILFITLVLMLVKRKSRENIFFAAAILLIIALFFLFGRDVPHYFFPFLLTAQIVLIMPLRDIKLSWLFIVILLALNLFFFPWQFYKPARNLQAVEKNFNQARSALKIPKDNLNVIVINSTYLSAPAYEYRFLLAKSGYLVDDEYSYLQSQYLLLVSETGDINTENLYNFESKEFGKKMLVRKITNGKFTYYLFKKDIFQSFGGYYLGPFYYYIFAPALLLGRLKPFGVIIFNALIQAFFISLIYYLLKKKNSLVFSLLSVVWVGTSVFFLFSARQPGNAFSYVGLLALYCFILVFDRHISSAKIFCYGLISGLILNFHPVSVLVSLPLSYLFLL